MNTLLYAVFQDNPLLSNEIYKFCNGVPDYVRAEREYLRSPGRWRTGWGMTSITNLRRS